MTLPARCDDDSLAALLTDLLDCAGSIEAIAAEPDPAQRVLRAESVLAASAQLAGMVARVRRDAICELGDAGMTVRAIAAAVGLSAGRVGQILAAEREARWGSYQLSAGDRQRHDREAYRVARHAQEQRAEAAGGIPGNEEWRGFFGAADVAQRDDPETALTYRQWLENQRETA